MITIDLAYDKEIAKELSNYLADLGIDSELKISKVLINKTDFDEKILAVFLEKTKREQHIIQKVDVNSFLISKMVNVEDLGLGTCEICGLVATEDKLFSHRWTHGAWPSEIIGKIKLHYFNDVEWESEIIRIN